MKIGNITSQMNYYQKKSKIEVDTKGKFDQLIIENKVDKTVSDKGHMENFKATEEAYDIRNATYEEFTSISNDLYQSKKISLKEHGTLTFNPTKSSQWSKITHNKANDKYYLTDADSFGKRNWLLEFEKRIENQRNLGNILGADHMDKTLSKIKKLLV